MVNPQRQVSGALQALRNAVTRAEQKSDPEDALRTLRDGTRTVERWLTGEHEAADDAYVSPRERKAG